MFPIANVSWQHAQLVVAIGTSLNIRLRGRCKAGASPFRVRVSEKHYVCPDVIVLCEKSAYTDDRADTITNPKVVIEVLSPSTAGFDRSGKGILYRNLLSLEEYVIVAQDAPFAEVIRRTGPKQWTTTVYDGQDAVLEIPSIGVFHSARRDLRADRLAQHAEALLRGTHSWFRRARSPLS